MNLFFADPKEIYEDHIIIRGQEAEHITKVLRMGEGDILRVTNGRGVLYRAAIQASVRKQVTLSIEDSEQIDPGPVFTSLCLGFIRKRDRLEFAVEKCVELGIRRVIIFRGEHSQKGGIRMDRLESISMSAMKQSLRCYLPEITVENSLNEAIRKHAGGAQIVLADEKAEKDKIPHLSASGSRFLVVGPEGGFSGDEREILLNHEHVTISLGRFRLRAETAAIVMAARFAGA